MSNFYLSYFNYCAFVISLIQVIKCFHMEALCLKPFLVEEWLYLFSKGGRFMNEVKGLLKIPRCIPLTHFEVTFEYSTKRNNRKRRVVQISDIDQESMVMNFWCWIQSQNEFSKNFTEVEISSIQELIESTAFKVPSSIPTGIYHAVFEYSTRKQMRNRTIQIESINIDVAQKAVKEWINNFNQAKPYRAFLNAQILKISCVDFDVIQV